MAEIAKKPAQGGRVPVKKRKKRAILWQKGDLPIKQMTEQHMINAFGGESMANMRYRHFAVQAEKEKFTAFD